MKLIVDTNKIIACLLRDGKVRKILFLPFLELYTVKYVIASEFGHDDFPFIALALKLNAPIWTNDKKLIVHGLKSGKYLAADTNAVKKLIQGESLEEVRQELNKKYLIQP